MSQNTSNDQAQPINSRFNPVVTPDQQAGRIEQLAREFHAVYQHEAKRQGDVRHHDDYEALSENVKEFDRALARYVLDREERLAAQLAEAQKERDAYRERENEVNIERQRQEVRAIQAEEQLAEREREIEWLRMSGTQRGAVWLERLWKRATHSDSEAGNG